MKKNYRKVRDESSHSLKHESAKSISKHAVHNPVLMKKVTCPVCQLKISSVEIEAHADNCAEKAASTTRFLTAEIWLKAVYTAQRRITNSETLIFNIRKVKSSEIKRNLHRSSNKKAPWINICRIVGRQVLKYIV